MRSQLDCHQKPQNEEASAFTNYANDKYTTEGALHRKAEASFATVKDRKAPMPQMGSWSSTTGGIFPSSCDNDSIKGMPCLIADGTKLPTNCFNSNHIDFIGNEFCANDPILGNRNAVIGSSLCHFPHGDISSTDSELEYFSDIHEDKENGGLLYYSWPYIGNFEDADRVFRNMGHNEVLSCFSSSSLAIHGSEVAIRSGLNPSLFNSNESRCTSKHHEPDVKFVVDTVSPLTNYSGEDIDSQVLSINEPAIFGHTSYVSWSDANAENTEQFESIGQFNVQHQQLKQNNQSEGKRKNEFSEVNDDGPSHGLVPFQQFATVNVPPSVPSYSHVFPSLDIPRQQQNVKPNFSSHSHTQIPYLHSDYKDHLNQLQVTPTSSFKTGNNGHPSVSSKASCCASNYAQSLERSPDSSPKPSTMQSGRRMGKPFQQKQLHAKLTGDPQYEDLGMRTSFTNHVSTKKCPSQIQDDIGAQADIKGRNVVRPAQDSSIIQQSSSISSTMSVLVSVEEATFQQLQYIMEQLDIRTKLCIRDSLYRLARSAKQRHNAGYLGTCSRNCGVKTEDFKTKESNKCIRFMDVEADTNPIDRSLAHLLFHKPLNVSTTTTNDVLSQESQAMLHWYLSTERAMSENLVCLEEVSHCAET